MSSTQPGQPIPATGPPPKLSRAKRGRGGTITTPKKRSRKGHEKTQANTPHTAV